MKLILFNIIGSKKNGTGHIYRSLSLAKEIKKKYKIIFITDYSQKLVLEKIKKSAYELHVCPKKKIFDKIKMLNPSIVINDILSTNKKDIIKLKNIGIKVINFEDLGNGNKIADLTINEIYQKPKININKILWGEKYFFLRDEFLKQKKNKLKKIKNVLLFFGGSDPNNLTLKTLKSIHISSIKNKIKIYIIMGVGYKFDKILKSYVKNKENIFLIKNTKKISYYMKKSQIAFTSNGRTTYELAHMNIPSFVMSHNNREYQHKFSSYKNGFVNLGKFNKKNLIFKNLNINFINLLNNYEEYKKLHYKMLKINFSLGRQRVKKAINRINKIF